MVDQWEPVSRDSVKTPLEVCLYTLISVICSRELSEFVLLLQVYEELQVEGYLVEYERVPITDEKPPKELDFDILVGFLF